ncbi:IclR family transcriptional regulator [Microbacterium lacticum]
MANNTLESLDRGLAAVELLERASHLSLGAATAGLGVSKATAFRILATLEARGWAARHHSGSGYVPGPVMLQLKGLDDRSRLLAQAEGPLQRLTALTGENANLARFDHGRVVYERVIDGARSLRMYVEVGTSAPLHATALGKAVLASLPAAEAGSLLGTEPLARYAPSTITDPRDLLDALAEIRAVGFSTEIGEAEEGASCLAAAILDPEGRPVGAVSISGPSTRMTREAFASLAPAVQAAARDVERGLSLPGPVT